MSQNVLLHHKQTIEPTGWQGGLPLNPQKFRKTTPQSQKEDTFLLLQKKFSVFPPKYSIIRFTDCSYIIRLTGIEICLTDY
jgi:hypothetical protein